MENLKLKNVNLFFRHLELFWLFHILNHHFLPQLPNFSVLKDIFCVIKNFHIRDSIIRGIHIWIISKLLKHWCNFIHIFQHILWVGPNPLCQSLSVDRLYNLVRRSLCCGDTHTPRLVDLEMVAQNSLIPRNIKIFQYEGHPPPWVQNQLLIVNHQAPVRTNTGAHCVHGSHHAVPFLQACSGIIVLVPRDGDVSLIRIGVNYHVF